MDDRRWRSLHTQRNSVAILMGNPTVLTATSLRRSRGGMAAKTGLGSYKTLGSSQTMMAVTDGTCDLGEDCISCRSVSGHSTKGKVFPKVEIGLMAAYFKIEMPMTGYLSLDSTGYSESPVQLFEGFPCKWKGWGRSGVCPGEQRRFESLSTIMKARHDTAKAAINNIR